MVLRNHDVQAPTSKKLLAVDHVFSLAHPCRDDSAHKLTNTA